MSTPLPARPADAPLRHRIHLLLEPDRSQSRASRRVDLFLTFLIVLNVGAVVLESTEPDYRNVPVAYHVLEWISVSVFSIEYLLRFWTCKEFPRFQGRGGRFRYLLRPMSLIDLLAIAPFYVELIASAGGVDLRVFRLLRLLRIARVAKLGRYSRALRELGEALWHRRGELVGSLAVLGVLLFVSSTLIYLIERDQPSKGFGSIPESMWWGIATLTTVGYGDVVPSTGLGKLLGAVIAVLGIGIFALPAGILSAALTEVMQKRREREAARVDGRCPYCGRGPADTDCEATP